MPRILLLKTHKFQAKHTWLNALWPATCLSTGRGDPAPARMGKKRQQTLAPFDLRTRRKQNQNIATCWQHARTNQETVSSGSGSFWSTNQTRPIRSARKDWETWCQRAAVHKRICDSHAQLKLYTSHISLQRTEVGGHCTHDSDGGSVSIEEKSQVASKPRLNPGFWKHLTSVREVKRSVSLF